MGENRNADGLLVVTPEARRTCGRPTRRWKDGIKMDLVALGWEAVDWICLVHSGEEGNE
jgi:hypothetical protein